MPWQRRTQHRPLDTNTASNKIDLAIRLENLSVKQLESGKKQFDQGLSSTADLILLEDALSDASLARLNANSGYNRALSDLDKAMGTTISTWGISIDYHP